MKNSSPRFVILLIVSMLVGCNPKPEAAPKTAVPSSKPPESQQAPPAAPKNEALKITSPKKLERATRDWETEASKWWIASFEKSLQEHQTEYQEIRKTLDSEEIKLDQTIRTENQTKGFVIFNRPFEKFILPREAPLPEEVKANQLKISLAAEEWEPVQVGVWPLKDISNFSCKVTALKQKNGSHQIVGILHKDTLEKARKGRLSQMLRHFFCRVLW